MFLYKFNRKVLTGLIKVTIGQKFRKRPEPGKFKLKGLQRDHPPALELKQRKNLDRLKNWASANMGAISEFYYCYFIRAVVGYNL